MFVLAFFLMIPLIVHHRIIDPFDTTFTACAEEWHQNMNARLVYDFVLLFVLFIAPLTLMTYCYIRISFSLWFIDTSFRKSISSTSSSNTARFSTISEDIPHFDLNDIRRQISPKKRPYYIHYHKTFDNDPKRKQQENHEPNEYHSLINSSEKKSISLRPVRSTTINDIKPKLSSATTTTTTTTTTTAQTTCRRSSSLIGRHFGENAYTSKHLNQNQPVRQLQIHHRHSASPRASGILRTSFASSQSQNRIIGSTSLRTNGTNTTSTTTSNNNNNNNRRSTVDVENASRFLRSRRRVVKLLITLGKI